MDHLLWSGTTLESVWSVFLATQQKSWELCQESSTGNLWLIRLVSHGFQHRSFHPFSTLSCNKVGNFHWCQTCLFPAFLVLDLWNFSLFCSFFQCLRRYLSWQGSAGSGSNLEVFSFCSKSSTTSNLTKAACHNTGPKRFNRSAQERSWSKGLDAMANVAGREADLRVSISWSPMCWQQETWRQVTKLTTKIRCLIYQACWKVSSCLGKMHGISSYPWKSPKAQPSGAPLHRVRPCHRWLPYVARDQNPGYRRSGSSNFISIIKIAANLYRMNPLTILFFRTNEFCK